MMIRFLLFSFFGVSVLSAANFRIDYTYDTNGFFGDPANDNDGLKERRDAIEAVADFFSEIIQDEFLAIDNTEFNNAFFDVNWTPRITHPSTGDPLSLPVNTVIPANEVVIFVGARDLSVPGGGTAAGVAGPGGFSSSAGTAAWFERIRGRGTAAADSGIASENTDFSPWGGSVAFADNISWNFSLTENLAGFEFVGVAIHEFCHMLGIGTSDAWENLITSADQFTGAAVVNSFGSTPPVQLANANGGHGHFDDPAQLLPSQSYGSFGAEHGDGQPVRMIPAAFDNGVNYDVMSDFDLAALVDIGWQIVVPAEVSDFTLVNSLATVSGPTSSFMNYQLQRSLDLVSGFVPFGSAVPGDAFVQDFPDATAPNQRAFYRLEASSAFTATTNALLVSTDSQNTATQPSSSQALTTTQWHDPIGDCYCVERAGAK